MKRKRGGGPGDSTPSKRHQPHEESEDELVQDDHLIGTPTKSSKKPKTSHTSTPIKSAINGTAPARPIPRSQRKVLFSTPSKPPQDENDEGTPSRTHNADRSARRKSSRRLIERTLVDDNSEDEASEEDDALAREILDEDGMGMEDEDDAADGEDGLLPEPETPVKRRRGRPKGSTRKRSPTPPQDLPPHERYFWQNRTGSNKTSDNRLPSNALLTHDEYFQQMQTNEDSHQDERDFLLSLHSRSYEQWLFELGNGFSICLYGYGSKRQLLNNFATHISSTQELPPKIVVINGYVAGITIRDILTTIAEVLLPKHLQLPVQPAGLLEVILEALSTKTAPSTSKKKASTSSPPSNNQILLLLNSIDSPHLRKPANQSILARLASHPSISLLATADTINFPLLWDAPQRSNFRFLFHDCTTFAPYAAELDVVESVNELLGRSGRRLGGKDGVAFVLRSLPSNARSLFRVLVAEQVAAAADEDDLEGQASGGADMDERERAGEVGGDGVEYRLLYRKAVEELICTNENGFRTLLKEFYDHQMVESRRDALGSERLVVPFRREELETLLEELVD